MPYIKPEERKNLDEGAQPKTLGQQNYVISKNILNAWNNNPCYDTIHMLADQYVTGEGERKPGNISNKDWKSSRFLAFLEFYFRIGRRYEDNKIKENGDLEGYAEAFRIMKGKDRKNVLGSWKKEG